MTAWANPLRAVALAAVALPVVAGAQQATGVVTGRVTDAASGMPVPAAQVQIVGTTLGGLTNEEGRYTIRAVPARQVTVRVLRVGYAEQTQVVTVAGGASATADLALRQVSVTLTPVVTTATGEQRRVEVGNSIAQVNAAERVQTAPVANMNDLLSAQAPGVTVLSGTMTGTGARVRIRGAGSLNLSNDPIYVIDGVRMTSNSNSSSLYTGGAVTSRVGDLNPEEIESIEIVKGPSAATLYGTDAANGVIVITTKKGRAGATRWTVYGEGGLLKDLHQYPTAYTLAGHSPNATAYRECTLSQVAAKSCVADSLRTFNVFDDPETTLLGNGNRAQLGLQVNGGTEAVRYFASVERENENGVIKLPEFERQRLLAENASIRDNMDSPNSLGRTSVRANVNAALSPKMDLAISTGFVNQNIERPQEANSTSGLGSQAFGGPGYKDNGNVSGLPAGMVVPKMGYRAYTPGLLFQENQTQEVNRFIGAATMNWRPSSWLSTRASFGNDFTARNENNLLRRGEGPPLSATYRNGFKGNYRAGLNTFTGDLAATASFNPRAWLNAKTTVGTQYVNYRFTGNTAYGEELASGTQTPDGGATNEAGESYTTTKTLGAFVEEAVAIRDRLFLTAAVRTDQNSAFGTDFQRVFYPKFSASYLVSSEEFFPKLGWLDELRVRGAYGAAGVQPGPNDALRTYDGSTINLHGTDEAAVVFTALGNTDLKPERTAEFEGGFDARLFGSRVNVEATYYYKRTRDALISAIVPPSLGAAASVRTNLASVRNHGLELLVGAQLVDKRPFAWNLTVNGSTNGNQVLDLGTDPSGQRIPPIVGTTTRTQVGYPLFGYWARQLRSFEDKNGDGLITYNANAAVSEIVVDDSSTFVGSSAPRYTAAVTNSFDLFNRALRVQTLVDYKGGHFLYNNTERIRCQSRANCRGVSDPNSPLVEQARAQALLNHPSRTLGGYFNKADLIRFRELSATYTLPDRLVGRALRGARSTSLTFAARNLGFWTKYPGIDPESDADAGAGVDLPFDFQTVAPPTYFTLRLNVGF